MTVLVSADAGPTTARTGDLLLADRARVAAKLENLLDAPLARHQMNGSDRRIPLVALSQPRRAAVLSELMTSLQSLLDAELSDLLVEAWSSHRALISAGRRAWARGAETTVRLAPHTVRVQQDPELDLQVDDRHLLTLRVQLDVTYVVAGALLLVREGRLVEVRPGNPKVEAVLSVEGEEISRRTGRLVMDAGQKLGNGVALSREPSR